MQLWFFHIKVNHILLAYQQMYFFMNSLNPLNCTVHLQHSTSNTSTSNNFFLLNNLKETGFISDMRLETFTFYFYFFKESALTLATAVPPASLSCSSPPPARLFAL